MRVLGLLLFFGLNVVLATQPPCVLLNDGNKMPMIALGTGRGTAKETDTLDDVRNAVFWAIEAGYRHIDTAAVYGDEEQVGQGIADAIAKGIVTRDQLFITTKLWNDKHARDQVVPALKESLSRLGLEYVDLFLIHFPIATKEDGSPDNIDYLDTWKGMEEAKQLGLTTSIGVSNFNISQIDRLLANSNVPPAVNEFEVNPTLTQEPLVYHCMSRNIAVMAYSPFGFLVSRNRPEAPPPKYDDPIIGAIAAKYGKSPGQVVLRFAIERGLVPIPKSTNQKRIAENINVFDFELSAEEIAAIASFNKNVRVIEIDGWKDYPNYPF
ncbi:aldo-keto reductase AKR2E4-like [Spodoptera litura]|uniref:Aldo-keto reductase AKR2E4-like n=1 Tax=Spodoptera litura TaxID=69820 RepID=A0A9J7EQ61_SPOLT|nr:aldo-keto reductase AKR2E4-like [Spodoptera litura]